MPTLTGLRQSARSFARVPGASLALLITIALGIGGNAAVAGFIRGSMASNIPLPGIGSVVSLFAWNGRDALGPVSPERYRALRARTDVFEAVGAARESQRSVVHADRSSIMSVMAVTPEVADMFQLSLRDGVIVNERVRQTEFGAATDMRSAFIGLDGVETRIAGVAPTWLEGLYAGRAVDIWMPLREDSLEDNDLSIWPLGRLRQGVSIDQARTLLAAPPGGSEDIAAFPYTGMTPEVAGGMSRIGRLLTAAATAVFLIACATVATSLLSRASSRARETSIRVALGANRRHLARQLLWDSALVSTIGGALAVLLAVWTSELIPALFLEQDAEHLRFSPDATAIGVVSAVCVAITIVCGLLPLVHTRQDTPALVLRREIMGPSKASRRVGAGVVAMQMALCCLLVTSTGLLFERFRAALETGPGQHLSRSILVTLEAARGYARPNLGLTYFQQAEQAAQSLPGVTSMGWVETLPGGRPMWQTMRVEPPDLPRRAVVMDVAAFTPRSLASITLPPIAGRMFGGGDTPRTCRVAIVNTEAASDVFGGDAVGRSIEDPTGQRVEIIGVVAQARAAKPLAQMGPTIYYYEDQAGPPASDNSAGFLVPDRSIAGDAMLDVNVVSPKSFDALGLQPVAGSLFPADPALQRCRIGVVNQEAAERYFGGHPVGGAVINAQGHRTTIVGVVRSTRLRATQRAVEPAIYLPLTEAFRPRMTLMLRARQSNASLLTSLRRRIDAVSGGATLRVTTFEAQLSRTALAPERVATVLVAVSAVLALLLSAFALYGAMTETARQQRREIGIRIAMGAPKWRVVLQVLKEGIRLAMAGTIAGTLGAVLVARWVMRMTPSAGPLGVGVWLAAPFVMTIVVAVASLLPARRALSINPLATVRDRSPL